jgi:Fe-S cluster assembly iron-binding protein IscA
MKNLMLTVLFLAATGMMYAQDSNTENEKKETTVTKTTVKDSKGVDVNTKEVTKTETQDMALKNFDGTHNFDTQMLPTKVNTDVDYSNDGVTYRFAPRDDTNSFSLMTYDENDVMTNYATLRPSSQAGYYILTQDGVSSFGYFNQNGNFVVESYDPESDSIVTTLYTLDVKSKTTIKKSKMK